jgi:hypothetical protein
MHGRLGMRYPAAGLLSYVSHTYARDVAYLRLGVHTGKAALVGLALLA